MDIKQANIEKLIPCADYNGPFNGPAVDVRDYDYDGQAVLVANQGSGTTPTADVHLEEADDPAGPWTDIGAVFNQVTDAQDAMQMIPIVPSGRKRYIRAVLETGGTGPSFTLGVLMMAVKKTGRTPNVVV